MTVTLLEWKEYFKECFKDDLTIEDLKKVFEDLQKGIVHKVPFCYCPACLFPFHLFTHPRSKKKKDDFFLGWLLYITAKRKTKNGKEIVLRFKWREVKKQIFQISGRKFRNAYYHLEKSEIERIGGKYVKHCCKAYAAKLKSDCFLFSQSGQDLVHYEAVRRAALKALRQIKILDENFCLRFQEYVKQKGAVTQWELQRHFSDRERIDNFLPLEVGLVDPLFRPRDIFCDLSGKVAFYAGKDKPLSETIESLKRELAANSRNRVLKKKISALEEFQSFLKEELENSRNKSHLLQSQVELRKALL